EVFNVAGRVRARQQPSSPPPFKVFTVGRTTEPIKARGGLSVTPHYSFANHPPVELLIVPGGVVTAGLGRDQVIPWIAQTAARAKTIASVCTGAFLLAKAGLLDGKRVTTHWEDMADLKTMFPGLRVEENVRWVEQGNLVTSAGISAGIDMCLHLVSRLENEKLAIDTARQMDYQWARNT